MKEKLVVTTLENVSYAAQIIRRGGLVVYPTDTVYGLGCDPFNTDAVKRLIRVKSERDKPLPILASGVRDVERVAELNSRVRGIVWGTFWPGPLTLILPKKSLPSILTFGMNTVGVRIPKSEVALKLIELSGGLLVGTSANKSGYKPPCNAKEAQMQLYGEVDIILDGGTTQIGVSSTILDLTGKKPKIIREGYLSEKDLIPLLNM